MDTIWDKYQDTLEQLFNYLGLSIHKEGKTDGRVAHELRIEWMNQEDDSTFYSDPHRYIKLDATYWAAIIHT